MDPEPKILAPPPNQGMFGETNNVDLSSLTDIAKIVERVVSQNTYDEIAQGKYYI